jgi:SF-assemblin/beta giardin
MHVLSRSAGSPAQRADVCSIGEDLFKISERIDCERRYCEECVSDVVAELHAHIASRGDADAQLAARVRGDLSDFNMRLNAEVADRVAEDEAIVHAVNEYTRALQEGLRIVGSP